ncbi:MAG: hypothetical protein AAGA58_08210 [Verrucomicrobiota bacterium]
MIRTGIGYNGKMKVGKILRKMRDIASKEKPYLWLVIGGVFVTAISFLSIFLKQREAEITDMDEPSARLRSFDDEANSRRLLESIKKLKSNKNPKPNANPVIVKRQDLREPEVSDLDEADLSNKYMAGYILWNEGKELAESGQLLAAREKLNGALEYFGTIKVIGSEWQPRVVDYRSKQTREYLDAIAIVLNEGNLRN